jgi:hypothetical protein
MMIFVEYMFVAQVNLNIHSKKSLLLANVRDYVRPSYLSLLVCNVIMDNPEGGQGWDVGDDSEGNSCIPR